MCNLINTHTHVYVLRLSPIYYSIIVTFESDPKATINSSIQYYCLKKRLNASKPFEYPPNRGKKYQNVCKGRTLPTIGRQASREGVCVVGVRFAREGNENALTLDGRFR